MYVATGPARGCYTLTWRFLLSINAVAVLRDAIYLYQPVSPPATAYAFAPDEPREGQVSKQASKMMNKAESMKP